MWKFPFCIALALGSTLFAQQARAAYVPSIQQFDLTAVGVGTRFPDAYTSQQILGDESIIGFNIENRSPVGCIQLVYSGYFGNWGKMETNGTTPFQVAAALWVDESDAFGGNFTPTNTSAFPINVTFGKQPTGVVSTMGSITSDDVCYNWKPGQRVYARTRRISPVLAYLPTNYFLDPTAYEYSKDGFFTSVTLDPTYSTSTVTSIDYYLPSSVTSGGPYAPNANTLTFVANSGYVGTLTDVNGVFSGSIPNATSGGSALTVSGNINLTTGEITLTFGSGVVAGYVYVNGQGMYNTIPPDDTGVYSPTGFYNWGKHPVYGPSAILGRISSSSKLKRVTIGVGGDSIDYGVGSTYYRTSWTDYANNGRFGMVNFAQPGAHLSDCATQSSIWRSRSGFGSGLDRLIINMGVNDLSTNAGTLATMQNNFKACAAYYSSLLPNGYKDLYWATITPFTDSTNTPIVAATVGSGTVASGSPSLRNAWNSWLYTQVGVTIGGVIDTNACVENNPASQSGAGDGVWKSLTYTGSAGDDLHPSTLGHQTIGQCAATQNSPVWSTN